MSSTVFLDLRATGISGCWLDRVSPIKNLEVRGVRA